MSALVREPYARNLFKVMRTFNITPASPEFYNMTPVQLEFMLYSIQQDEKEIALAQQGLKEDSFVEDEEFKWDGDLVTEKSTDADDVLEQISKLTGVSSDEQESRFQEALLSAKKKAENGLSDEEIAYGSQKQELNYSLDDEDVDTI